MGSLRSLRRPKGPANLSYSERRELADHLMSACFETAYELASALTEERADVNSEWYGAWTPLTFAIDNFPQLARQLLNHGADPNMINGKGESPLHAAVWSSQYGLISRLIKMGAEVVAKNWAGAK